MADIYAVDQNSGNKLTLDDALANARGALDSGSAVSMRQAAWSLQKAYEADIDLEGEGRINGTETFRAADALHTKLEDQANALELANRLSSGTAGSDEAPGARRKKQPGER